MNTIKKFDTLYGFDKYGKIKEWNIFVENKGDHSVLCYSYGYKEGKKVECEMKISKGKNIGKKNQTTHFEQAVMDAQSKWNKKKDIDKYTTDMPSLQNTQDNSKESNGNPVVLLPMLAQEYKKHAKKLQFPCYIQPKLDGYRMIYNGETKRMTTRTGKEYNILKMTELGKSLLKCDLCLDGELYVHDKSFAFEKYGVLRKQKDLIKAELDNLNKIEYHVYDLVDTSLTYAERLQKLQEVSTLCIPGVKIVKTYECQNGDDINRLHQEFIKEGYEGSMVRNKNGMYQCKYRSYDLLKYKDFDDGEYKIVGFTAEKDVMGGNEDLVVWVCTTDAGQQFNVQSKGTKTERAQLFKEANKYIGQRLWVQHFGLTNDGIPRFPKTLRAGVSSIRTEVI